MQIEVTEFVRPNGNQIQRSMYLEDSYADKYNEIIESGCRFTVEITSSGQFFLCLEDNVAEEDYVTDIFQVFNADDLIKGVQRIIESYDAEAHAKWQAVMQKINGDEPPF